MRYEIKEYGFLSFAKTMGKNLSNKYGQKLLDSAKQSIADAIKTASKRAIQKTAESIGNLICNKIADEITSVSKKSSVELRSKELHSGVLHSEKKEVNNEIPKERYISPEKRQKIIDELRLVY